MRVLVVEDSSVLRNAIATALGFEGYVVESVACGQAGLVHATCNPFDLIVLDLGLPRVSGFEVLRAVRERRMPTPVLILTARTEVQDVLQGFNLGANDYLKKPFAMEELLARCRELVRRRYSAIQPKVKLGASIFQPQSRRLTRDGQEIELKARELRILEYLIARRGAIVTREEIEDHVYRTSALPSSNSIEAAICCLRRQLDTPGRRSEISTVRGLGYRLEAAEDDSST